MKNETNNTAGLYNVLSTLTFNPTKLRYILTKYIKQQLFVKYSAKQEKNETNNTFSSYSVKHAQTYELRNNQPFILSCPAYITNNDISFSP